MKSSKKIVFNNSSHIYKLLLMFFTLTLLSACSTTPSTPDEKPVVKDDRDPFETLNRKSWDFTWDYADKYVFAPASKTYVEYTPEFVREGLYNMALNLNEPSSIINNILQGKFKDAGINTARFVMNSTVGLFGIFDPASDLGWKGTQEEFGEVLGTYGVGDGPFIVIPALGPSSVREEVGDYVDKMYWPLAIIDFWPNLLRVTIIGLETRASLVEQESIINESIDPYEFVKNAYFQNMNFKLYDGNPPIVIDEDEEANIEAYLEGL